MRKTIAAPAVLASKRPPRIALALGGGGARGLAHIVALEVFDRLDIRPVMIAGTSIGAILGAAYAAGHSGAALRKHAAASFKNQAEVMTKLFRSRVGRFADLWKQGLTNPVLVDGEQVLDAFWPSPMPADFAELSIPLKVIAADYHRFERVVFDSGALLPAIAASMAIPGIVRPVVHQDRVLVDGYAVDPLPVSALDIKADLILAIDVSRRKPVESLHIPSSLEATFGAFELMQAALSDASFERLKRPALRIKAPVEQFGVLDFFAAGKILHAADAMAAEIETALTSL